MFVRFGRWLAAFAAIFGMFGASSALAQTKWPNGARAAVVLTYDDALVSQLDKAIPALNQRRLAGTFFLSGVRASDVPRWRAAATAGHELANHTIFHPCAAATFPAEPRFTTETYTPATMLREIEQQNTLLTAIDGRQKHGFSTPCVQTVVGGVDYLDQLRTSGLVTYVRGVSYDGRDARANVAEVDPMRVPARGFAEGTTGKQLIDLAKQAQAQGGWAVYLFHGVGGDHLAISDEAHRELLDWLAANRETVWVATLDDALAHAKGHR